MTSARHGEPTSGAEVTNVSTNGVWLLLDGREMFLAFAGFPWFEHATIRQICQVERPSPHHLYWPALDVDLAVDSIIDPASYPLISKPRSPSVSAHEGHDSGRRPFTARAKRCRARR